MLAWLSFNGFQSEISQKWFVVSGRLRDNCQPPRFDGFLRPWQEMNKVSDKPGMAATEVRAPTESLDLECQSSWKCLLNQPGIPAQVKRLEESMEDFQHTLKQFGLDVKDW